jgi:thiosulfate dehydrogenase
MRFLFGCIFTVLLICAVVVGVAKLGLYPVNADADPSWLERRLSHWAVDGYVPSQAKMLSENPLKPTESVLMEGMKAFKSNCAGCHGSPADKEGHFGKAFFPKAPQFGNEGLDDDPREIFWITKHGIRMTGMPAFGSMLKDDEMWKIVTFIGNVPKLPANVQNEWIKKE